MAHYLYEGLTALGGRGRGGLIGRAMRKNYELMTRRREVDMALAVAKEQALGKAGAARLTGEATIRGAELAKEGTIGGYREYAKGAIGAARERKLGTLGAAKLGAETDIFGYETGAETDVAVERLRGRSAVEAAGITAEAGTRKAISKLLAEGDYEGIVALLGGGEEKSLEDLYRERDRLKALQGEGIEEDEEDVAAVRRYFPDQTPSALEVRQRTGARLSGIREKLRKGREYRY